MPNHVFINGEYTDEGVYHLFELKRTDMSTLSNILERAAEDRLPLEITIGQARLQIVYGYEMSSINIDHSGTLLFFTNPVDLRNLAIKLRSIAEDEREAGTDHMHLEPGIITSSADVNDVVFELLEE